MERYIIELTDDEQYRLVVYNWAKRQIMEVLHASEWIYREDAVDFVHDHYPNARSPETLLQERW